MPKTEKHDDFPVDNREDRLSSPAPDQAAGTASPDAHSALSARARRLRYILSFFAILLLGLLSVGGYAAWRAHTFLNTPPETPGIPVTFTVNPGDTFDRVAYGLKNEGVITNVEHFRLLGHYREKIGSIQAGEFLLSTGWVPDRVLDTLVSGAPVLHRLSIREGLTMKQTAEIVEQAGFATREDFLAACRDKALLERFHIPFDTAEGFLFPETYFLPRPRRSDGPGTVALLLESFWKQAATLWPDDRPDEKTLRRIVTLASIVEKESGYLDERATVAGVFANRLRKGMRLQSDVTIIYGLGDAFDGNLTKKHLRDKDNPYNSYQHAGLPPGPICSPGLDALEAALNPAEHSYLYFVSRRDGTHHFSRTLREHNAAVRKYQLRRR